MLRNLERGGVYLFLHHGIPASSEHAWVLKFIYLRDGVGRRFFSPPPKSVLTSQPVIGPSHPIWNSVLRPGLSRACTLMTFQLNRAKAKKPNALRRHYEPETLMWRFRKGVSFRRVRQRRESPNALRRHYEPESRLRRFRKGVFFDGSGPGEKTQTPYGVATSRSRTCGASVRAFLFDGSEPGEKAQSPYGVTTNRSRACSVSAVSSFMVRNYLVNASGFQ